MPVLSQEFEPVLTAKTIQAESVRLYTFRLMEANGQKFEPTRFDITLVLNPESLAKTQQAKNAITETQFGQWVDTLGLAAPRWTISGNFGFKRKIKPFTTEITDGLQATLDFEEMVRTYFRENRKRALGAEVKPLLQLWFLDWADDDFWVIEPEGMPEKTIENNRPNIHQYRFSFVGIRDLLRDGEQRERDEINDNLFNRQNRMDGLKGSLSVQLARLAGSDDPAILDELALAGFAEDLNGESEREGWGAEVIDAIDETIDFIQETKDSIDDVVDSTIGEVQRIADKIDTAIEVLEESVRAADPRFLFADLIDTFRQVKCGLGALMAFPEGFEEAYKARLDALRGLFVDSGCSSTLISEVPPLR
jgi:hypothetical protein